MVMMSAVNIISADGGGAAGRCGERIQQCWQFEHPRRDLILDPTGESTLPNAGTFSSDDRDVHPIIMSASSADPRRPTHQLAQHPLLGRHLPHPARGTLARLGGVLRSPPVLEHWPFYPPGDRPPRLARHVLLVPHVLPLQGAAVPPQRGRVGSGDMAAVGRRKAEDLVRVVCRGVLAHRSDDGAGIWSRRRSRSEWDERAVPDGAGNGGPISQYRRGRGAEQSDDGCAVLARPPCRPGRRPRCAARWAGQDWPDESAQPRRSAFVGRAVSTEDERGRRAKEGTSGPAVSA